MFIILLAPAHSALGATSAVIAMRVMAALGWTLTANHELNNAFAALLGAAGGLILDLDTASSTAANLPRKLGKMARAGRSHGFSAIMTQTLFAIVNLPVRGAARVVEKKLGHRGPVHSIAAAAIISLGYAAGATALTHAGLPAILAYLLPYLCIPLAIAIAATLTPRGKFSSSAMATAAIVTTSLSIFTTINWGSNVPMIALLVGAGAISHLAADGLCRAPVAYLWWPFHALTPGRSTGWRPVPPQLRVRSGSWLANDIALIASLAILTLFMETGK